MVLSKHTSAHVTPHFKASRLTRITSKSVPRLRRPCMIWSQATPPIVHLASSLPSAPDSLLCPCSSSDVLSTPLTQDFVLPGPLSGMLPPDSHSPPHPPCCNRSINCHLVREAYYGHTLFSITSCSLPCFPHGTYPHLEMLSSFFF